MKPRCLFCLWTLPFLLLQMTGCGHGGQTSMAGFEGEYVQVDNTNLFLTLKEGHYQQGSRKIHANGDYHAHAMEDGGFELHVELTGNLAGATTTLRLRMEEDLLVIKDGESGETTRFKKME